MPMLDKLMLALDNQRPRWATEFASQTALREHAEGTRTLNSIREQVAQDLCIAIRAGLDAGIVALPASVPVQEIVKEE